MVEVRQGGCPIPNKKEVEGEGDAQGKMGGDDDDNKEPVIRPTMSDNSVRVGFQSVTVGELLPLR